MACTVLLLRSPSDHLCNVLCQSTHSVLVHLKWPLVRNRCVSAHFARSPVRPHQTAWSIIDFSERTHPFWGIHSGVQGQLQKGALGVFTPREAIYKWTTLMQSCSPIDLSKVLYTVSHAHLFARTRGALLPWMFCLSLKCWRQNNNKK